MNNNYDPIAKYYDVLSRAVYFRSQLKAQINQLPLIPANSNILIVGGGTGWILEEIAKVHAAGLTITYIEISAKMLEKSKKRAVKENHITYIHSSAENFTTSDTYDVILTAFFFDNFEGEKVKDVFFQYHGLLRKGGLWLFSDFYYTPQSGKLWQAFLLKTMYLFFKLISNIEAHVLVNMEPYFAAESYQQIKAAFYYGGFIKSIVYRKP